MKRLLKICGNSEVEKVKFICEQKFRPDFLGFVFYEKSPRYVSQKLAREFAKLVPSEIKKVAVTVNASLEELGKIVDALQADIIQLHGDESAEFVTQVKEKLGLPVMKAFQIETEEDLQQINNYDADYFLLDKKSKSYGGSGESFNWSILKDFKCNVPCFLAGGVNVENLHQLFQTGLACDVSGGLELQKGIKDVRKIEEFLEIYKKLDSEQK
jgi:phosphoribosylanthranilate isomerase